MARTIRGHPTDWFQQEGTEKPENNPSIPWQEEKAYATKGKVIANYKPDVDYEPEGSEPEIVQSCRR